MRPFEEMYGGLVRSTLTAVKESEDDDFPCVEAEIGGSYVAQETRERKIGVEGGVEMGGWKLAASYADTFTRQETANLTVRTLFRRRGFPELPEPATPALPPGNA